MKTKISLLFLGTLFALCTHAQEKIFKKSNYDRTPFVGRWVATDQGRTYELTFTDETFIDVIIGNQSITIEVVIASAKWIKDGNVIRETKTDGIESILHGSTCSNVCISTVYYDREKEYTGSGTFTLDSAENPQTARWLLRASGIGKNRGKKDFPTILTFKKIK